MIDGGTAGARRGVETIVEGMKGVAVTDDETIDGGTTDVGIHVVTTVAGTITVETRGDGVTARTRRVPQGTTTQ